VRRATALACLIGGTLAAAGEPVASTYLFEWTSRTGAATFRLSLFTDRILVRKTTSEDGKTEFKKRKLSDDEYSFYEKYFSSPECADSAGNFETGLSGEQSARSLVTIAPPNRPKWSVSFDSFSALSSPAAGVKAALERLRDSFGKVLPNEADFSPEKLVPGTILRRRDGEQFRVVHMDEEAKIVEMQAVGQPYSQFFEWAKLRYTFLPP
jgi:hypothetical protein